MGCAAGKEASTESSTVSVSPSDKLKIRVEDSDGKLMYSDDEKLVIIEEEPAFYVLEEVGASKDRDELKKMMQEKRDEIRKNQEKLNSSLTTPIVDRELKVLESGTWLNEKKDLSHRYNLLPPINSGSKVKARATAFTVD